MPLLNPVRLSVHFMALGGITASIPSVQAITASIQAIVPCTGKDGERRVSDSKANDPARIISALRRIGCRCLRATGRLCLRLHLVMLSSWMVDGDVSVPELCSWSPLDTTDLSGPGFLSVSGPTDSSRGRGPVETEASWLKKRSSVGRLFHTPSK